MDKNRAEIQSLLVSQPSLWQENLLNPRQLADYARKLGVKISSSFGVYELWKLGLLRADLIRSSRQLRNQQLIEIKSKNSIRTYIDIRTPKRKHKGWANEKISMAPQPKYLELRFHPYRVYVLHHVHQVLNPNILPHYILRAPKRYPLMVAKLIDQFNERSKTSEFSRMLDRWNFVAELAIQSEPHTSEQLFGTIRLDLARSEEQVRAELAIYSEHVYAAFKNIGEESLREVHQAICCEAQTIDGNKHLKIVLRLLDGHSRKKINGVLGASILFLTMAESIRRSAETAFGEEWPEEDEQMSGTYLVPKTELYGARRLANPGKDRISIIRNFGLDYAPKIRWYVEGDTEYYALSSILTKNSIELINLRGQVVQKGALAFRDSLRGDISAKRFSFITLDGDREDFLRIVRKAAADDEICGMFFVNQPDFEFANFDHDELILIALNLISNTDNYDLSNTEIAQIDKGIRDSNSGAQLDNCLKPFGIGKGQVWGEEMMNYAWDHIEMPGETDILRPIIDAIKTVVNATNVDWRRHREKFTIDPKNEKSIKR